MSVFLKSGIALSLQDVSEKNLHLVLLANRFRFIIVSLNKGVSHERS
jgi:hypothetical protein